MVTLPFAISDVIRVVGEDQTANGEDDEGEERIALVGRSSDAQSKVRCGTFSP